MTIKKAGKVMYMVKEEVKLLLFADNIIRYKENPRVTRKSLLEVINEYNIVIVQQAK